jgi:hypothetical protein
MADQLCFPDNDPVLGVPTIDGFADEDAGVFTNEAEPGYGLGARFTFESGAALPQVIFQGVKHTGQDFIYLSFFVRFDVNFDDQDVVVVALREKFQPKVHNDRCRRIDIYPVHKDTGAGPAGDPFDQPPVPNNTPGSITYKIRGNKQPARVDYWKGAGTGTGWTSSSAPAGIDIKVRSWQPPVPTNASLEHAWSIEVKLPITDPGNTGNWLNLDPSFGLYFNVIRVCANQACFLPGPVVGNPGFMSNQFIWPPRPATTVSPWLTGVLNQTTVIDPNLYGEALIPGKMTPPPATNPCSGVKFVGGALGVGIRRPNNNQLSSVIDLSPGATNTLTARIMNDSANASGDAPRVTAEFRLANWGITSPDFAGWAQITTQPGSNPTAPSNVPHGTSSLDLATPWELSGAQITQYTPHFHQCMWVQLDEAGIGPLTVTNATNASPIAITTSTAHGLATGERVAITGVQGNTAANTTATRPSWTITRTGATTFTLDTSTGNGAYTGGGTVTPLTTVNFVESSMRRNMDFVDLSEEEREAEISGVGHPPPPAGRTDHDFVLMVNVRRFMIPRIPTGGGNGEGGGNGGGGEGGGNGGGGPINVAAIGTHGDGERLLPTWTWFVHGYRVTGEDLEIDGTNFKILDPAPGAFGYVAQHDGPQTDELSFDLSGGGIRRRGNGVYTIRVPDGGSVTINTKVEAGPLPSKENWLLRLLRRLLEWLLRLLRRLLGR